jgi:hypothetical protein
MKQNTKIVLAASAAAAVAAWYVVIVRGVSSSYKKDGKTLLPQARIDLIKMLAEQRGIEPAVALAILDIESGGAGFSSKTGKVIIRYEPHVFKKYMKNLRGKTVSVPAKRGGQSAEYENLAKASAIDPEIALQSISMGMPQIMGFNFKWGKYKNVFDMWKDFHRNEGAHIRAYFRHMDNYLKPNKLTNYAKNKDFTNFARYYNGAGGVGTYDKKMEKRYKYWVKKGYA